MGADAQISAYTCIRRSRVAACHRGLIHRSVLFPSTLVEKVRVAMLHCQLYVCDVLFLANFVCVHRVSEYLLAHPSSASEVLIPDPLCVAIALWPSEIIAGSYRARVGVELGGSHCRGMTWVDRKAVGPAANVTVVSSLVMEAVRSALVRSVTA